MAAELKGRKWIGCEIGPTDDIENRFALIDEEKKILDSYRSKLNNLFPSDVRNKRNELGLWVCESFHKNVNIGKETIKANILKLDKNPLNMTA